MKILFTSDVHEDMDAFKRFSRLLRGNEFELGVIAGDLTEYDLTLKEIASTPGVEADDLLEELYDPEDTVDDLDKRVIEYRKEKNTPLAKAVRYKEKKIREILLGATKTIVVVPGNHDLSEWKTGGNIRNVHNRPYYKNGYKFIGYRYTSIDASRKQEKRAVQRLTGKVEPNTILITHAPPFGILDKSYRGIHSGSEALYEIHKEDNVVLHLFGHIHHSFGFENKAANGSYAKGRKFIGIDVNSLKYELV